MKRHFFATGLSFAIIFFAVTNILAKDPPTSAEQLRNKFESALKARDTNTAMSLFYMIGLEGDGPYRRKQLSSSKTQEAFLREMWPFFPTNVSKIKLAPLPKEYQALHAPKEDDGMGVDWNGDNGWRTRWSVPPVGMFESQPPVMFPTPLIYGKTNGAFYIGIPIVYTAPGKSLYARVTGGGTWGNAEHHAPSLTYTGSWIYVKNSKEIKVDINEHTNQFRECWGDYIKSFNVRQTSTNTMIMVDLHEDDKTIFDSGRVDTGEPIIYDRK